jgi:hypothetical protein
MEEEGTRFTVIVYTPGFLAFLEVQIQHNREN